MEEKVMCNKSALEAMADKIREKTGNTEKLKWKSADGFGEEIENIKDNRIDALIDKSITEISSNATSIGDSIFHNCYKLTTVDFPLATSIGTSAFEDCSSLTTANFSNATSIGIFAFYGCSSLTTIDFPAASLIGGYAFASCSSLTTVNFLAVTSIEDCAFQNSSSLITADFSIATSIKNNAFYGCSALRSLILRNETMATLSSFDAFTSSGVANGTGYIYVPSALINNYKTATNWSTYATQFRTLEEYTVDGTITGELDETKINA